MIKEIKKRIFWLLTLQRKNVFGRMLFSISQNLSNSLNNKINDGDFSGEYWFLKSLNHSEIKVVFDIGANVGNWSKKVFELNPISIIHAFEPVPETFQKLEENTAHLSNFIRNRNALSDEEGKLKFNYYPNASYLSSAFKNNLGEELKSVEVEMTKGDQYCEKNQINHIDFLKIDTEGFESKVLFGFEKMFKKKLIKIVQFEYGPLAIYSKFLLCDFYDFFECNGYRVGKIYPNWVDLRSYSKDMENFVLSNFVAIREGL